MENLDACGLSGLSILYYYYYYYIIIMTLQYWRFVGMKWICFDLVHGAN